MGMLVQKHVGLLVFLVFVFSLNPQLSFCSSSSLSNVSLPTNDSPLMLCHPLQSHALLLFKSTFTISINASLDCQYISYPSYPKTESWKEGTDCCSSWDGVTCDAVTGHVIGLDLNCSQLQGTIRSNNSLFSSHIAPYLERLNLAYNDLSSSNGLLDFVGNYLTSLRYLNIGSCNIRGSIPPSFNNLTQLTQLRLSRNHLSGLIPALLGNLIDLTHLSLTLNHLSGPIPTSFSNLTQLAYLYLGDNELEGPFPSYLFALPSLDSLILSNNKLYGHISISPMKSRNLAYLDLSNNSLNGSLDFDVFLSLNQLSFLDLSKNNISSSRSASTHSNFTYSLPNFRELFLSGCNLKRLPTFIKALTNLTYLIVSNNQIQGSIPDWMHDVGKDTLKLVDLSENSLTGFVGHLNGWKSIERIYLSSNLLKGSLPIVPKTIAYLDVANNSLSGVISSSICNLSILTGFDLSYNQFTGPIPQCLVNISALRVLNLGVNELHGVIPNTFVERDNKLLSLVLKGNQLTGPIPPSLAHCVNLALLDLGNNMIEDTVPHWLKKLPSLEFLILRSNKFFGSLNDFKPTFLPPSLRILDLSNNNFHGQLPVKLLTALTALTTVDKKLRYDYPYIVGSYKNGGVVYSMLVTTKGSDLEYVKIWATFAVIDLSGNKFEGHIPREIGKLISLKGLNLSRNLLTGHIPSSMADLASLEWLDLSSNKLDGQIPKQLTNMTFLSVLNLSHNQLDGPIPQGKQFDTFTNDSYMDNLALCGLPLSKSCWPNHEPPSVFDENKGSSDSKNGFNWAFAFAGYGCGVVLGLSMGYIVFETGKPKWFMRMVDGKKQHGRFGQRPWRGGRRRH